MKETEALALIARVKFIPSDLEKKMNILPCNVDLNAWTFFLRCVSLSVFNDKH